SIFMLMGLPCQKKWMLGRLPSIHRIIPELCSTLVRVLFGKCSSVVRVAPEGHPKNIQRITESVSNQSRSGLEACPKDIRTAPEETARFLTNFSASLKKGSSIDAVRM